MTNRITTTNKSDVYNCILLTDKYIFLKYLLKIEMNTEQTAANLTVNGYWPKIFFFRSNGCIIVFYYLIEYYPQRHNTIYYTTYA